MDIAVEAIDVFMIAENKNRKNHQLCFRFQYFGTSDIKF